MQTQGRRLLQNCAEDVYSTMEKMAEEGNGSSVVGVFGGNMVEELITVIFPRSLSPAGFELYVASMKRYNFSVQLTLSAGCIFFRLNRPNSLQFV